MPPPKSDLRKTLGTQSAETPAGSDEEGEWLLIVMSGNQVGQIFDLDCTRSITVIGRDDVADVQVLDGEVSRRHAALRCEADRWLVTDLSSQNGTFVNDEPLARERALTSGDKLRLGRGTILRLSRTTEPEAKFAQKMYQAVLRDGLTGAFNRRYFDDRIDAEIAFATRHEMPLSVLLIDIDHFKRINDEHGHQTGDVVLKAFTKLLQSAIRSEDVLARYGGEEFAVLCRETDADSACLLAERLRVEVAAHTFAADTEPIEVTVSIGVSDTEIAGNTAVALIASADRALYAAKNGGRNRCKVASG